MQQRNPNKLMSRRKPTVNADVVPMPQAVDWEAKGYVSPVKDQGSCGSCYTFSTTSALESHYAIASNSRTNLSEQNLLDCTYRYGNQGCNGGFMDNCFDYIIKNKGIDSSPAYPYEEDVSNAV